MSVLLTEGYSTSEIENVLGIEAKVIDNARTRLKRKLSRLLLENGSVCQAGGKKRRKREDLYYKLAKKKILCSKLLITELKFIK